MVRDEQVLAKLRQHATQAGYAKARIERRTGNGRHGGAGWYIITGRKRGVFLGSTWQESIAALAAPDFILTPEQRARANRSNERLR